MGKKNLLVVAHAPSENTLRLFEAVGEGAKSPPQKNVTVNMLSPFDAVPRDVIAADAIILGTTENLGYMSGALKFFDRCYYPVLVKNKVCRMDCTFVPCTTALALVVPSSSLLKDFAGNLFNSQSYVMAIGITHSLDNVMI